MTSPPSAAARGVTRRARVAGVLVAVALLAVGGGLYRLHRLRAAAHWVAPVLVDPGPGPRAPVTDFLGARVGASSFEDVRALTAREGLACADRGVRVLMGELRDRKRAEVEAARLRGTPDAVSGASILGRRTARDENPQIRLSCEDADSARLADRPRPPSRGRVLFVFDGPTAPLRHASYQRTHSDFASARADFDAAREATERRLGPGKEIERGPSEGTAADAPLAKYSRRVFEWRFADVVATVSLGNLGPRGLSVAESLEVPLPLRADAPAR